MGESEAIEREAEEDACLPGHMQRFSVLICSLSYCPRMPCCDAISVFSGIQIILSHVVQSKSKTRHTAQMYVTHLSAVTFLFYLKRYKSCFCCTHNNNKKNHRKAVDKLITASKNLNHTVKMSTFYFRDQFLLLISSLLECTLLANWLFISAYKAHINALFCMIIF